ncbi:hypothetical protein HIM_07657 [Hirsutella minnesotensis 3608]|uniref:PH domain-containing protein n=1 Tax=Hirsutella minnesotensis 3608 TaxID=1043627 RepID=A0A0F8A436_9HYPO|nr:hypothetical protein HIM_07657 [Hirsutella minnesotensis 3608]
MDSSKASVRQHGSSSPESTPPLRRRYSMEEDMFYNHIMTAPQRRPSQPPPYRSGSSRSNERQRGSETGQGSAPTNHGGALGVDSADALMHDETLPGYKSTVSIQGVFSKKHEIENTTKRAEDRHWHPVFVVLEGTALNIYSVKKDWGWGKTRDGPTICPDNPPWMRKGKLEKSYTLLHADAGIAADYTKRRYVIRVRAETDQFLLSCIELTTFIKWLECLFAAIDVAAPIDDRDFPRDMSIPRVQRIRWFQGQSPALPGFASSSTEIPDDELPPSQEDQVGSPPLARQSAAGVSADDSASRQPMPTGPSSVPARLDRPRRLSLTNYPNASINPHTGKWFPEHRWSSAHDLLYAKLCYSNLLFRSPRKSNYIISRGKQWFVDWGTGKMVRVLPPTYGEVDFFGPWQVIHTENFHI